MSFNELKIRSQDWNQHLHQFVILQKFQRRAVKIPNFGSELILRKTVDRMIDLRPLRGSTSGNKEMYRFRLLSSPEFAGQFKTYGSTHAMAKEGKGYLRIEGNISRQILN